MEDTIELKNAQEILDEFESIYQIRKVELPSNLDEIWSIGYDILQQLSVDELAHYSFILAQYSLYIQKIYNKESSKYLWLENKIQDITCDKLSQYDQYTKYEVKLRLIARENEPLRKLLGLLNFTKQKMTRLEFIPSSIKTLSDKLDNIQRMKSMQLRSEKWAQ